MRNLTHKQFNENLIKDLSGIYPGARLTPVDMKKPKGLSYQGISFVPDLSMAGPVINTDQFYKEYRRTRDYEGCLETVRTFIEESLHLIPGISAKTLLDYDAMKENLVLQMLSIEGNEELLETLPHRIIGDMALCCRFLFDKNKHCVHSMLVNRDVLKELSVDEETLFADALHYAPINKPFTLTTLEEMVRILEPAMPQAESVPIYVASVEDSFFGASVLAYPDFLEYAADVIGGSYYVIPSSVHEVLLISEAEAFEAEELHEMLCNINDNVVEEEDILSYSLYLYDEDTKTLEPIIYPEPFAGRLG